MRCRLSSNIWPSHHRNAFACDSQRGMSCQHPVLAADLTGFAVGCVLARQDVNVRSISSLCQQLAHVTAL